MDAPLCVEMDGTRLKRVLYMGTSVPNVLKEKEKWTFKCKTQTYLQNLPSKLYLINRAGTITIKGVPLLKRPILYLSVTTKEEQPDIADKILRNVWDIPPNLTAWVNVTILIPESPPDGIYLRTFSGDVTVHGVHDTRITIETFCGFIRMFKCHHAILKLSSRGGVTSLYKLNGTHADLTCQTGEVSVDKCTGGSLQIETQTADVEATNSETCMFVCTQKGNIYLNNFTCPTFGMLYLYSKYGKAKIQSLVRVGPTKFVCQAFKTSVDVEYVDLLAEEVS